MVETRAEVQKYAEYVQNIEADKLKALKAQADAKQAEAEAKVKTGDTTEGEMMKLSEVADQLSSLVAPLMTLAAINEAHGRYAKKMDGAVTKDERCTDQQLSCLIFLFKKLLKIGVADCDFHLC